GVHRDLVRTGAQQPVHIVDGTYSAADGERDEDLLGGPGDHVEHGGAVTAGGGDVEEGEFVGALGIVGGGELDRIPGIAQILEVDALDHPPGVDVQAGDDTCRQGHERSSPPPGAALSTPPEWAVSTPPSEPAQAPPETGVSASPVGACAPPSAPVSRSLPGTANPLPRAAAIISSSSACTPGAAASTEPDSIVQSAPSRSVTIPPAHCTISAPAALSHGW